MQASEPEQLNSLLLITESSFQSAFCFYLHLYTFMPITSLKTGQTNNVYTKNILCGSVTLLYTQVVSGYMLFF